MKFFFCCQSVRPLGQIQLHEKRQLANWVRGSEGGMVRGIQTEVAPLRQLGRVGKTTLALPTECTEVPLLTHPPLKPSLMH